MTSREEVDMLMGVRKFIEERIKRLEQETEMLRHALERVKTLQIFEEVMKKK
ncbi:MAG: hypothetical protein KIH10_17715 [Candidatus Freyarchaeota archaeon]|nr:hypothetical protein [Candidatus Jordarchaeia archaeon]